MLQRMLWLIHVCCILWDRMQSFRLDRVIDPSMVGVCTIQIPTLKVQERLCAPCGGETRFRTCHSSGDCSSSELDESSSSSSSSLSLATATGTPSAPLLSPLPRRVVGLAASYPRWCYSVNDSDSLLSLLSLLIESSDPKKCPCRCSDVRA